MKIKDKNGYLIIETLIAVLVFSFGIISILNYQKDSIAVQSTNQNRIIAINYANKLANILLLDQGNVSNYIGGTSNNYQNWLLELKSQLPYVNEKEPTVNLIEVDGKQFLSITIYWKNSTSSNFSNYNIKIGLV